MPQLYFAYGSNMSVASIRRSCADIEAAGIARLPDFRLAFTRYSPKWEGGVADVIPAAGMMVWGVLYEIDRQCMVALDLREGNGVAYIRGPVTIETADGARREALTYRVIQPVFPEITPTARYMHVMDEGAGEHQLPADYYEFLVGLWAARHRQPYRRGLMVVGYVEGDDLIVPAGTATGEHTNAHYQNQARRVRVIRRDGIEAGTCLVGETLRAQLGLPTGLYGASVHLSEG
jgi:cation transport regulator ChaC